MAARIACAARPEKVGVDGAREGVEEGALGCSAKSTRRVAFMSPYAPPILLVTFPDFGMPICSASVGMRAKVRAGLLAHELEGFRPDFPRHLGGAADHRPMSGSGQLNFGRGAFPAQDD